GASAVSIYYVNNKALVVRWDVQTGQEISRSELWNGNVKQPYYRAEISTDGTTGVLNVGEPQVLLWNVQSGQQTKQFTAPTVTTLNATLTRDGSKLLITAQDGALRLWDVGTGTVLQNLLARDMKFDSVA